MGKIRFCFCLASFFAFISTTFLSFLDLIRISSLDSLNDLLTTIGSEERLYGQWFGQTKVDKDLFILVLAGHADSQGLTGAGTRGEAVSKFGDAPMDREMTDELFWNLLLKDEVTKVGKEKGLNIISYDPVIRNIFDENDPRTNWSVGAEHAKKGGYAIEIHFDSYGKYGSGGGLIPPLFTTLNKVDESLAKSFGRFPMNFRGGLGASRRNIRILEIGKLEGELERNLRDLKTRDLTIRAIAVRIVNAISFGIGNEEFFNPTLDEANIFLPAIYL